MESLLLEAGVNLEADRAALDALVTRHERLGARLVPIPDPAYPEALRALDDAPLVLSVRGQAERLADPSVAIVGSRAATLAARRFAHDLARDLAREGITIVSGLARGIDAEAHRGALEAGGATFGVLACGVDRIYPPEHRRLAEEMVRAGAILSELPLGTLPRPLHFPLRNRIISGLARAVVVVEARSRSGSLITVRHALNQGREVFVVPGTVDGPFAAGTNQLLREGARAIRSARDLLEDLGIAVARRAKRSARAGTARGAQGPIGEGGGPRAGGRRGDPLEAELLALLDEAPRTSDELLAATVGDPGRVATVLLELELAGRVVPERDGRIHPCRRAGDREPVHPSLRCAPPEPEEIPP
ncbi:MAG: DNA-processing protein DprA [Myxococcota bacterium]